MGSNPYPNAEGRKQLLLKEPTAVQIPYPSLARSRYREYRHDRILEPPLDPHVLGGV
jgi:hypothetical protein